MEVRVEGQDHRVGHDTIGRGVAIAAWFDGRGLEGGEGVQLEEVAADGFFREVTEIAEGQVGGLHPIVSVEDADHEGVGVFEEVVEHGAVGAGPRHGSSRRWSQRAEM